jgi:hypothetical protein
LGTKRKANRPNVRFWHFSDIPPCTDECPLSGGKADMTLTLDNVR